MQVAEDILSIAEFKAQLSRVVHTLRARGRPVVITQGGKAAAVVLAPEAFDRLSRSARFIATVEDGLADEAAGRVVADAELDRELGLAAGPPRHRPAQVPVSVHPC